MNAVHSLILMLSVAFPAEAPKTGGAAALAPTVASALTLRVDLPKKTYGRSDEIEAEVTLTNNSSQTVFVRRFAGWGESSSVSVWIHDLSGKSVNSGFLADELDPPVVSAKQLEELRPGASKHFTLNIPLADYDLTQGKSYQLTVVYHSSISSPTQLALPLLTAGHPPLSGSCVFAIK